MAVHEKHDMASVNCRAADFSLCLKLHGGLKLRSEVERSAKAHFGFFHQLQQPALDAPTTDISTYDVGGRGYLVDFIEINDSVLGQLDIAVCLVHEFAHEILNVSADVAGLRELGRIRLYERDSDQIGDRAYEV